MIYVANRMSFQLPQTTSTTPGIEWSPFLEKRVLGMSSDLFNDPDFAPLDKLRTLPISSVDKAELIRNSSLRAQVALDLLQSESRLLERYIRECAFVLTPAQRHIAPINLLPPEIICKFFTESQPINRLIVPDGSDAVKISAVCRLWRSISTTMPSLWSTIDLTIDPFQKAHGTVSSALLLGSLRLHLRRSRNAPLTLSITAHDELSEPLLATLVAHSNHWYDINICGSGFLASLVQGGIAEPLFLPLLEYLKVSQSSHPNLIQFAFEDSPVLHSLDVCFGAEATLRPRFPWNQITSLKVMMDVRNIPTVLEMCPLLQKLSIIDRRDSDPIEATTLTVHTQLQDFTFEFRQRDHIPRAIFRGLHLPAALRITFIDPRNSREITYISDDTWAYFLSRSPLLEELIVDRLVVAVDQLIQSLQAIPKLTSLFIRNPTVRIANIQTAVTNKLLMALRYPSENDADGTRACLVPQLQSIELGNIPDTHIDTGVLCDTIASRTHRHPGGDSSSGSEGVGYLRRVHISTTSAIEAQRLLSSLQQFHDEGVDVKVGHQRRHTSVYF